MIEQYQQRYTFYSSKDEGEGEDDRWGGIKSGGGGGITLIDTTDNQGGILSAPGWQELLRQLEEQDDPKVIDAMIAPYFG